MKKIMILIALLFLILTSCKDNSSNSMKNMPAKTEKVQNISKAYLWEMKTGAIYIRTFPKQIRDRDSLPGWASFGITMW